MNECDHIIGYVEVYMEAVALFNKSYKNFDWVTMDKYFKYCPLCGEKLKEKDNV